MLLAIDVGNTNIVLGVFDGTTLVQSWRLQTLRERTSDELGLLVEGLFAHDRIERSRIRGVILGSVVPPLTGTMETMARRYFGVDPLTVEPGVNTGMPILYEKPSEVGADRILNAVAGYETCGRAAGRPMIVVDFGTATDTRRDHREGRVPGRRDLSRCADFRRRAVPAGGAAPTHRRAQAVAHRRPDHGRRDAVGVVLRLRSAWSRASHAA
jgi:pantothenate kinase type III